MIGRHGSLVLLLVTFIVLGSGYSLTTPIFEAPDEIEHYFYVWNIATGGGLPVQDPENVGPWGQEGGQPPLFYVLGALLTFRVDSRDALELIRRNPHANVGLPLAYGNKNVIIHTDGEAFPYRGAVLAVHLARLLSVVAGAATVLVTYLIALEIFPRRRKVALGAATINAFIPQFLFMSGAVSNDVLAAALCGWALLILLRQATGEPSFWSMVGLGCVVGLAALTKLSGLGLFVLVLVALIWLAWYRQDFTLLLPGGLFVLTPALVVPAWWYARNLLLYGDPLGLSVFLDIVSRREGFSWQAFLYELSGVRISFWALFGWFNVPLDEALYRLYDSLSVVGLAGLPLWAVKSRFKSIQEESLPVVRRPVGWLLGILALWVVITFVFLIRWTWFTTGSQGRLLFPALSAMCVLLAMGLSQWWRWLPVVIGMAMGVGACLVPYFYIAPAYARPPILSEVPAGVRRLNVNYDGQMMLLGYELESKTVRRGQHLGLTLYWQSLVEMERDWSVYVHLFGRQDEPVGEEDTYPGLGNYPTSQWRAGDIVRDTYQVLVQPTARAPTRCRIDVGLYDLETMKPLPSYDEQGQPVSHPAIEAVKIDTWVPPHYEIGEPVHFDLEGQVTLIGYKLDESAIERGGEFKVALYWQAEQEMSEDYTVFVHLLDGQDTIRAQHDGPPMEGDYPTTFWEAGEVVKDEHVLTVDEDASPGRYQLVVGMYRPADGRRLALVDGEGQILDDKMVLREMVLEP